MKYRFIILFLLFWFPVFSQEKFVFDYILLYDFQKDESAEIESSMFLTNSKDNTYFLSISLRNDQWDVVFSSQKYVSFFNISQEEFKSVIMLNCDAVKFAGYPFKEDIMKNYHFITAEPKLIHDKYYVLHVLKSVDLKREKRKKLPTFYYCVERDAEFHLPILLNNPIQLNYFEEKPAINGLPKEMYYTYYGTEKKYNIYSLREVKKNEMTIIVPEECVTKKVIHN